MRVEYLKKQRVQTLGFGYWTKKDIGQKGYGYRKIKGQKIKDIGAKKDTDKNGLEGNVWSFLRFNSKCFQPLDGTSLMAGENQGHNQSQNQSRP